MSQPRPTPQRLPQGISDGTVRILMDRIGELEETVSDGRKAIEDLTDRVSLLEARATVAGSGRRALNDDAIQALRFMETHWPMKFTALTLSANLGPDVDHRRLGGQLRVLLTRGLVEMHQDPGHTNLWSAVDPAKRPGAEDA